MTLEFHCPHCDKALRTSDDKAGRLVKCPHCGSTITVAGAAPVAPDALAMEEHQAASAFEPSPGPASTVVPLEAGEVIATSWAIFKTQVWTLVAATVVVIALTSAASYLMAILGGIFGAIFAAVAGQVGPQNRALGPAAVGLLIVVQFATSILAFFFQVYLQTGQTILFLKVARGQPADLGDIFRGGNYLLRALGANLLFALMVSVGIVLLIVPGVILALMFWPFMYVLIDTDPPGMQCLSRARVITANTWGTMILLWLTSFGLGILGVLACCIGLLFTTPLTMLLYTVAYCRMTAQPTARV